MSNQSTEAPHVSDRLKILLGIFLLGSGLFSFYWFSDKPMVVRIFMLLGGIVLGALLVSFSSFGGSFANFLKESWLEILRVSWPSRQETWRVTLIVFVFVLVVAVFLFSIDKMLELFLYGFLLGGRR